MKKTLLDLFVTASKAALNAIEHGTPIQAAKAKFEAAEQSGVHALDEHIWSDYYDGELARFKNLAKSPAPSAPKDEAAA